jgi:FecR protein
MRLSGLKLIASGFLAALLSAPAWAANPALPGTLNYVEGQVSIGTEALNAKSVGSTNLATGQTITTETGKAEVLLTPGVFFRLGDNSAATMMSPSLTNTEIALNEGQALVEVDDIHKDNLLRVQEDGATTELLKAGIYGFDAGNGDIRVFKGEALVQDGEHQVKVKGGHQLTVENLNSAGKLKTTKFDKRTYEQSDLYRFSDLRSEYLAEANVNAAGLYYPGASLGWWGAGWYWDPWLVGYTWLPGDGWFASPFGWGFSSPLWLGYAGYYPYWGGYGYYGTASSRPPRHPFHPGAAGYRGPSHPEVGTSHFGVMGEGFHGGSASGGFHGGAAASGFHGGGFAAGGGFHR